MDVVSHLWGRGGQQVEVCVGIARLYLTFWLNTATDMECTYAHTHRCRHARTHTHTHAHARTHTHTHTHTFNVDCCHTYAHAHTHTIHPLSNVVNSRENLCNIEKPDWNEGTGFGTPAEWYGLTGNL